MPRIKADTAHDLLGGVAQDLLADAVAEFARATRFPVAFGGFQLDGTATVTAMYGMQTHSLRGLRVRVERGLGGRAMSEQRPRITSDYASCAHITHDYDNEVTGEGIRALFAVPVVVGGTARAVLYGGSRSTSMPGASFLTAASGVVRDLSQELRIEDEVSQRVAERAAAHAQEVRPAALSGAALEELRAAHAELRRTASVPDGPELRERLAALDARLARLSGIAPAAQPDQAAEVHLTPRELDVLAHAALGHTNAEIGRALELAESTIKSYLKSAMTKLNASTRHAAVSAARRHALIP